MKGAKTPGGYTIVEVMIVLAVSALMFLIAASFISGKEENTSFRQGVNQLASSIQSTIEQVSDGQYSDVNLSCNSTGSMLKAFLINHKSDQGTQSQCIFLGKIDQFFYPVSGGRFYDTYTVAGLRLNSQGLPVSPDSAHPSTPLDNDEPSIINYAYGSNQTATRKAVPQNLQVIKMGVSSSSGSSFTTSYALGVMQNLGTYGQSGTQSTVNPVQLYYVSGVSGASINGCGSSPSSTLSHAYKNGSLGCALTLVQSNQQVLMCVTDGTQYADIGIGTKSNQLTVNVDMLGSNKC